jgi:hypothetical protein
MKRKRINIDLEPTQENVHLINSPTLTTSVLGPYGSSDHPTLNVDKDPPTIQIQDRQPQLVVPTLPSEEGPEDNEGYLNYYEDDFSPDMKNISETDDAASARQLEQPVHTEPRNQETEAPTLPKPDENIRTDVNQAGNKTETDDTPTGGKSIASPLPSEPDTNLERVSSDPSDEEEQSQDEPINEETSTPTPTPYRKRKPSRRIKGRKKSSTSGNTIDPTKQTLQHPQQMADTDSASDLLSNRPQDTETPASQHEAPSESDRTPTSTTPSTKPSGFESQPPRPDNWNLMSPSQKRIWRKIHDSTKDSQPNGPQIIGTPIPQHKPPDRSDTSKFPLPHSQNGRDPPTQHTILGSLNQPNPLNQDPPKFESQPTLQKPDTWSQMTKSQKKNWVKRHNPETS